MITVNLLDKMGICIMNVEQRQHIEQRIVGRVVKDFLAAGYQITVNDGENDVLIHSTDPDAIREAMFSTDMDILFMNKPGNDGTPYVWFIYGNSGTDVIHDYSMSLSLKEVVEPIEDWISSGMK